jgi:hypothetical protein
MLTKHLELYVNGFVFRWNSREVEYMIRLIVRKEILV